MKNSASIRARMCRPRDGAATVEFAVTVPLVFFLFFGAVEFSQVNMIRNTAENAAYEGARRGVVPGATSAQAEAAARDMLQAVGITDATVTVTPQVIEDDTDEITVNITIPLDNNTVIAPNFFRAATLRKTCTLTRERTRRRTS